MAERIELGSTGTSQRRKQGGRLRSAIVAATVALTAVTMSAPAGAVVAPPAPTVKVIVQQLHPADPGPAALVAALGGTVTAELPIVTGFAATVPTTAVSDIVAHPGVRVVSGDHAVVPSSAAAGSGTPGPSVHREVIGSSAANAQGITGAGTTVAVIDTGIADVAGFHGRIRPVVDAAGVTQSCVNLSTEPGCQDSFGHGTFVAGMVHSVAPDADLIAIKLSGRDGSSNVSTVLSALQWVIANRGAHGIDVVNLSMRSESSMSYRLDPLNLAVEQVWANGITMVVAAGNQGSGSHTIAKPGDDPWVITVGATDDRGTVTTDDDTVASFSSRGPTVADGLAKPDLAAPGRSVHSLRSPGSEADIRYPYFVDAEHRLGSGTSFAAPEVAGAAALLHQADPSATNDRVKFALMATARPVATALDAGAGSIDVVAALDAPAGLANQQNFHPILFPAGAPSAVDLAGTQYQGTSWQGTSWQGTSWQGTSWQGTSWQGTSWQGTSWQGTSWQGTSWQGTSWQGTSWQGTSWQ